MTSVVAVSQGPNGCVPTAQLSTALADASLPIPKNTREFVLYNMEEMPAFPGLKLLLLINRKRVSSPRGRPDLATPTAT